MAGKIIRGLILGVCVGGVAYLLLKDITLAIVLGAVWCLAMIVPNKRG